MLKDGFMGRKSQITKEQMLQAAYEILKEEGYAAVNIKTIAANAGCSTQPISWQFGNMQGLRKELYGYASQQIFGGIETKVANMNAMTAFFETGKIYISSAFDYPHVFRFLCVDDPGDIVEENNNVVQLLGDDFIKDLLAKEIALSRDEIDKIVADIVIYTHGLAVIFLWDAFKVDKETAYEMIYNQALLCFGQYGIDVKKYVPIEKKGRREKYDFMN